MRYIQFSRDLQNEAIWRQLPHKQQRHHQIQHKKTEPVTPDDATRFGMQREQAPIGKKGVGIALPCDEPQDARSTSCDTMGNDLEACATADKLAIVQTHLVRSSWNCATAISSLHSVIQANSSEMKGKTAKVY